MKPTRVLIVEDERIVARDLQASLQRAGYEVPGIAASGEEAIELAHLFSPDVLLMDIMLQGEMDGVTTAGRLRRDLGVPVIYLSTCGDRSMLDRAKATEPIGYVLKPYEEKDLLMTVEMALHQFRSARQRAESALLAQEARFRTIFESAAWGVALVNQEGRVLEANPAFYQMLGYEAAELSRRPMAELLHPDDQAAERKHWRELFEGQTKRFHLDQRLCRKAGQSIWTRSEVCLFPSSTTGKEHQFALRMVEDLTEEKRLQEQFLRSQRMEIIGVFTSGLTHNLNNVLAPALMGVQLLRSTGAHTDYDELLASMETGLMRGVGIIRQLLNFGRGVEECRATIGADVLLHEIVGLVRELFTKQITVQANIPPDLGSIHADANQLHQAMLNLCANARDAMKPGGKLTLSGENVEVGPEQIRRHPEAAPGPYVALSVEDTGSGIPPEVLERLFEPFFTTKPVGKGTGLGLATTLNIVKGHGGFAEVHSQVGVGSRFTLYLPAASPSSN